MKTPFEIAQNLPQQIDVTLQIKDADIPAEKQQEFWDFAIEFGVDEIAMDYLAGDAENIFIKYTEVQDARHAIDQATELFAAWQAKQ